MVKLSKSEKMHLLRICLFPIWILSLLVNFPHRYLVAITIFCIFWGMKIYAKYLAS